MKKDPCAVCRWSDDTITANDRCVIGSDSWRYCEIRRYWQREMVILDQVVRMRRDRAGDLWASPVLNTARRLCTRTREEANLAIAQDTRACVMCPVREQCRLE